MPSRAACLATDIVLRCLYFFSFDSCLIICVYLTRMRLKPRDTETRKFGRQCSWLGSVEVLSGDSLLPLLQYYLSYHLILPAFPPLVSSR